MNGGERVAIALSKIKKELMSRVNGTDAVEIEKVERYLSLIELMRDLQSIVKKEGSTVVTDNGPQKFTKAHPALPEISKLNSQLITLEKSFKYKPSDIEIKPQKNEDKKVSLT